MKRIYKRKAWLLDDGILLEGYTSKRKFIPNSFGCGFSSQKIKKKNIGKILFYNKEEFLKKYKEIEFSAGNTIEDAVNKLLNYNAKGKFVVCSFNGTMLYSNIVTMDRAYKKITGKTKYEFDKAQRKMRDDIEKQEIEHKSQIPELVKTYMKKGREILTEDKWDFWDKIVPIRLNDLYHGMELGCCLDIIKILNNNGTLEEAKKEINNQDHSGMSFRLVCAMIKEFCKRGQEFVNYVK